MPRLSQEDVKEIDAYWAQYGIRISDNNWFRWYYGVTGIHDPRFISTGIYRLFLAYNNNQKLLGAYRDKAVFDRLLLNVNLPYTLVKKVRGRLYSPDGALISPEKAKAILASYSSEGQNVILKGATGSFGKQVKKMPLSTEADINALMAAVEASRNNTIIQEAVKQHPFFSQFNESSVNIIRIYTLYLNGRVHIMDRIALRYGQPGFATDVCYIDGKEILNIVGISKDGYVRGTTVDRYGNYRAINDVFHLSINRVPSWDEIIKIVISGAEQMPYFNWIGWDIIVNTEGKPIAIEYNINVPGNLVYQYYGPLFGDLTDEVFAFLKSKRNREKYIPPRLALKNT